VRHCFVCRLCATLFVFFLLPKCLFGSYCHISFDPVQIQPITLASSTLQIRRHDYFGDFNIVIFVGLCTLPFYAINMDDVSLFTYSSFLFLANLYCIIYSINLNECLFVLCKKNREVPTNKELV